MKNWSSIPLAHALRFDIGIRNAFNPFKLPLHIISGVDIAWSGVGGNLDNGRLISHITPWATV
jgi:hypothetical protein